MKNPLHHLVCGCVAVSLFALSCKKDVISTTTQYPALAPANIDLNADNWKPILVTSAAAFTVNAPDAVTSPAYVADLNEIKGYQASLTDDRKALIQYWSAGAVLRWKRDTARPGCQA